MTDTQFEALLDAAGDGVSFDGLTVESLDGRYTLATPEETYDGLRRDELRERATLEAVYVTNWYYWTQVVGDGDGHRFAFLRWLEHAGERDVQDRYDRLSDGITRSWGQLLITTGLDDAGYRTYEVRHAADRDADPEELAVRTDPLDARSLTRFDEDGRYRPLKTAPTLPTGWLYSALDGHELVRAIDRLYPATVANWHLEREGRLDVTHWREAADRQTGIYDVVDELPPAAVEWAVEACCVDSQCLKRRRWDLAEGEELDVARGDGAFPCREPCSLLVAAARQWAILERETPRTYTLELTPSERAQLEAIVDAVADGRITDVREAAFDDPANRYRVRYLRAKHFDGGWLSRTDPEGETDEE